MQQTFTLTIPTEYTITNNRASPIWLRTRVKNYLDPLTRAAIKDLTPAGKATVFVGITKRTATKYDPTNLSDTFKPVIDTLVKTGILDEDNYSYVIGPFCYHAGVDKNLPPKTIRARITLTEYAEIPF